MHPAATAGRRGNQLTGSKAYHSPRVSPPAAVIRPRTMRQSVFSEMNRTLPSQSEAWQPPTCWLNGSSFGPQLLVVHGQAAGPPFGVAFWLMSAPLLVTAVGGPETPLPLSPSAQRFGQELPVPPPLPYVSGLCVSGI